MTEKQKLDMVCICCPLGCNLSLEIGEQEIEVTGNKCPRGAIYAKKEVTAPTRIVTSSIRVEKGSSPMVSVKTKEDVPKGMIFPIMKEIHETIVTAPIQIGDILISNCCNTGIDIIATKQVD